MRAVGGCDSRLVIGIGSIPGPGGHYTKSQQNEQGGQQARQHGSHNQNLVFSDRAIVAERVRGHCVKCHGQRGHGCISYLRLQKKVRPHLHCVRFVAFRPCGDAVVPQGRCATAKRSPAWALLKRHFLKAAQLAAVQLPRQSH